MTDDRSAVARAQSDDDRSTADLIAEYRRGPSLLRASIDGLSREQLLSYPVPGKMSAQEVICHVADCEPFLADRLKRTIAMDRPLLVGVDGWLYLDALHYTDRDIELDLAVVDAIRTQMAADLDRIPEGDWERTAVHTETGLLTLRQLLLHAVRHLEHHIATIDEKRDRLLNA